MSSKTIRFGLSVLSSVSMILPATMVGAAGVLTLLLRALMDDLYEEVTLTILTAVIGSLSVIGVMAGAFSAARLFSGRCRDQREMRHFDLLSRVGLIAPPLLLGVLLFLTNGWDVVSWDGMLKVWLICIVLALLTGIPASLLRTGILMRPGAQHSYQSPKAEKAVPARSAAYFPSPHGGGVRGRGTLHMLPPKKRKSTHSDPSENHK